MNSSRVESYKVN